jgi:hypothetical protein
MMDVVSGIFALVTVAALFGGIAGVVAPRTFQFSKTQPPSRKRIMGIAMGTFVAAFIGFAITMPEPTPEQRAERERIAKERAVTQSPESAIISTVEGHNIPSIKRSVVVRLSREISHDDLVDIGTRIRERDKNYERVFIEYYLPEMREGAGAWAVTHWNPKLDARILGREQVPSPIADVAPRVAASEPTAVSTAAKASAGSQASCVPTHETDGWAFIENNAVRLADGYAARRMPQAVFAFARPVVRKQLAGKFKGQYLLSLIGSNEFIQLEPLFDFCSPAEKLDDEGNLWRVVSAKYGEKEF